MIELDGAEAGGQFVRTAVALSALSGKGVKIENIRGARPAPGLKAQHTEGIKAIAEICDAEVKGLNAGSRILEFVPKKLHPKDLEIKISTAGSIGLVLQALMLPASHLSKRIKIQIEGGATWGKWAPPLAYMEKVLFPLIGEKAEVEALKEGFYPKGGASVKIISAPWKPSEIEILETTNPVSIEIISLASSSLEKAKVAERQAEAAEKTIKEKIKTDIDISIKYENTLSTGSGILVALKTENSIIGADALGEIGIKAEDIGKSAAEKLLGENGAVDIHAADMLLPYIALGGGAIKAGRITDHIKNNVHVIEKFLDVKFKIDGKENIISLV